MKTVAVIAGIAALANAHATWQQLWKNGEDLESTCARLPPSNSPIEDYTSTALQCNVSPAAASGKCGFAAGDTVTIEMHQHNTRLCTEEGIGGAHWGPVLAYMSKVDDAATADGSSEFFKVYENTWKKAPGSTQGDNDYWGTKDLNYNCGKLDFTIPEDIAPGDYLLRAEAIALHAASSSGGAQHYVTCYQVTVTGDGTATPAGVKFPEAYSKTGSGLGFSIHQDMSEYPAPGPALYARGTKVDPQLLTFGEISGVPKATGGASASASSAVVAPSSTAVASAAATSAAVTSAVPASSAPAETPIASSAAATSPAAPTSVASAATSAAASSAVASAPAASSTPAPETGDKYNVDSFATYLEAQPGSDAEFTIEEFIAWLEKIESGSNTAEPTAAQSSAAAVKPTTPAPASSAAAISSAPAKTTLSTVTKPQPTSGSDSGSDVEVKAYGRCGGEGYTGSSTCASGFTCKVQNPYYSQCVQSEGNNAAQPSASQPTAATSTAAQPTASKPAAGASSTKAATPTATASSTAPAVSKEAIPSASASASAAPAADKLWTIQELIAFLEEAAE
ncbi:carbohydrate-binding module family 1 protein [Didymella exigua CBS 183.55]|uniref:AA9 family lytic polysaccharide monooxygenase n=1 Tax=Didymella exigua CBS 183.55 TaxID=1150837 RepID=A0A6A5RAD7_9PLEO|nr:carbohydrate-binding module family 1 protein [Didymella exigua CBS 183.55]KAF1924513.1 carbohydrate-binding module family 1 protein [Didymella exigua CBS 183.55]